MKGLKIGLIIAFVALLGWIVYRSYTRSEDTDYMTTKLARRNISETIQIPGNVYPTKEIEIKSQLSGILDSIYVRIGDTVVDGSPIASIKLVPSTSDIERLESNVNVTQIEYESRTVEYERAKRLYAANTLSKVDMDEYTRLYRLAKENLMSAKNQLDILKKGRVVSKNISNIVRASTAGTIIDIPFETGASMIERNTYNPGTTVAIVAETGHFKFRTWIAEHYLRHVQLEDTIMLTFNAYSDLKTRAVVTKISSKGNAENGIMKYMLDAEFTIEKDMPVLRSGYSATATITLNNQKDVLSIEEKYLTYRNDSTYVHVLAKDGKQEVEQNIHVGVSDGVYTEIISGIDANATIITNYDKVD